MEDLQHFEHKNDSFLLFPWLTKWCLPLKIPQPHQYVFWIPIAIYDSSTDIFNSKPSR